jgi:hypothetical protein
LVLTLGSLPEKGGKKTKKNRGINPGQLTGKKGGEKKNPGINPGQTAGLRFQDLVLSIRRGPETKIDTWTDRQTDRHHLNFNI